MPTQLTCVQGDLTAQRGVDAMVNAANPGLLGGGGVDGAIHRAGGPAILAACQEIRRRQGRLPPGQAVITPGGALPARYVIHTVGPVWRGGEQGEADLLSSCYRASLALAVAHGLRAVAFPSISTGAYGYPLELAAPVAIAAVRAALPQAPALREVRFVLFSAADYEAYRRLLGAP